MSEQSIAVSVISLQTIVPGTVVLQNGDLVVDRWLDGAPDLKRLTESIVELIDESGLLGDHIRLDHREKLRIHEKVIYAISEIYSDEKISETHLARVQSVIRQFLLQTVNLDQVEYVMGSHPDLGKDLNTLIEERANNTLIKSGGRTLDNPLSITMDEEELSASSSWKPKPPCDPIIVEHDPIIGEVIVMSRQPNYIIVWQRDKKSTSKILLNGTNGILEIAISYFHKVVLQINVTESRLEYSKKGTLHMKGIEPIDDPDSFSLASYGYESVSLLGENSAAAM